MSELPQARASRCINLCSKAMAVYGEAFASDPDFDAGLSDIWCNMTARAIGPDDGEVSMDACCDKSRQCYREY
jgi:hypothetical protein